KAPSSDRSAGRTLSARTAAALAPFRDAANEFAFADSRAMPVSSQTPDLNQILDVPAACGVEFGVVGNLKAVPVDVKDEDVLGREQDQALLQIPHRKAPRPRIRVDLPVGVAELLFQTLNAGDLRRE